MGAFADSIKKNIDAALKEQNDKAVDIIVDVFNQAVVNSPTKPGAKFAKGEFINNWFPMINGLSSETTSSRDYNGTGSYSRIAALRGSNVFLGKDGYITLSNNLNYSMNVEYSGWIKTGPYAPLRQAILYAEAKYKF